MGNLKLIFASLLIGFFVSVAYLFVELIDTKGTNYLWNELLKTDENRFLVIPVTIIFSIIFSLVIILLKQKRITKAEVELLDDGEIKPNSIKDIFTVLIIGSTGLLAGASLGPEGVLVAVCSGIGIWLAGKSGKVEAAKLLVLSSISALLVGFFGSLLPLLIPIIILYKKEKKIIPQHNLPPILAGLGTYITLYIIKNGEIGFGTIPTGSTYNFQDLLAAFLLGLIGAFFAILVKILVSRFQAITNKINTKNHWIISAIIFGGVIGFLYFIGGPTVQFSGKEGTEMLLQGNSTLPLIILIVVTKFIAMTWSLSAGYKGGLVFPSIFIAVALSLALTEIHPILGGPGITIGATSGMMTAMLPPFMGFILVLSLIPFNFVLVALSAFLGTIIGKKITDKVIATRNIKVI